MKKKRAPDICKCGGCGGLFDAGLLDAVLLDADGNYASAEAYCKACWPKFKRVPGDKWRSLYCDEVTP